MSAGASSLREDRACGPADLSRCASQPEALVPLRGSSAVISDCGTWRYRLDRLVQERGLVAAFFGVNGSTAGPIEEDQTTKKWRGFSLRNSFRRYIAGNPFALRAKDVKRLASAADPVGPENARYLAEIIAEADVLIPCWGRRDKVPRHLYHHIDALKAALFASGKPILIFGLTDGGDPKHPLMLSYETPLVPWSSAIAMAPGRAANGDLPVPQDCQARAEGIAQTTVRTASPTPSQAIR